MLDHANRLSVGSVGGGAFIVWKNSKDPKKGGSVFGEGLHIRGAGFVFFLGGYFFIPFFNRILFSIEV